MHLLQILLPLTGGHDTVRMLLSQIRQELVSRFGGVTLYRNAPAEGLWEDHGDMEEDRIVLAEVMTDTLDHKWWAVYRETLEARFEQDEIVIRDLTMARL